MGKIKKRTREPIQFYSSNSYHHHKWHLKKCIKQSKVNSSDGLIDYMVFPPALFLDFFSRKLFNFLKIKRSHFVNVKLEKKTLKFIFGCKIQSIGSGSNHNPKR